MGPKYHVLDGGPDPTREWDLLMCSPTVGDSGNSSKPIRPILGFRESKVSQNGRFPALDAEEPPCKICRRWSLAEKSVTVQTSKQKKQ